MCRCASESEMRCSASASVHHAFVPSVPCGSQCEASHEQTVATHNQPRPVCHTSSHSSAVSSINIGLLAAMRQPASVISLTEQSLSTRSAVVSHSANTNSAVAVQHHESLLSSQYSLLPTSQHSIGHEPAVSGISSRVLTQKNNWQTASAKRRAPVMCYR